MEEPGYDNIPDYIVSEPLRIYRHEELEEHTLDDLRKIADTQKSRFGDERPNHRAIQVRHK